MQKVNYTTKLTPDKLQALLDGVLVGVEHPLVSETTEDISETAEQLARYAARTEQKNNQRVAVLENLKAQLMNLFIDPINEKIKELEVSTTEAKDELTRFAREVYEETGELPKTHFGIDVATKRTSNKIIWPENTEQVIAHLEADENLRSYVVVKKSVNKTKLAPLVRGGLQLDGVEVFEDTDVKPVMLGSFYERED